MTIPTLAHETIVERRGDDALARMTDHVLHHHKPAPDGVAPQANLLEETSDTPPAESEPTEIPAEPDPYVG